MPSEPVVEGPYEQQPPALNEGGVNSYSPEDAAQAAQNILKTPGDLTDPVGSETPLTSDQVAMAAHNEAVSSSWKTTESEKEAPLVGAEYDHLFTDTPDTGSVEDAAVRPPLPTTTTPGQEAARQTGIANADKINREKAGLPPRTYDLK